MDKKVRKILGFFEQIDAIPRCSKQEAKIAQWLQQWAESRQLPARKDAAGNMLIKVPPSAGFKTAPVVVIQGHLDMVCEKSPDANHDFSKDPIRLVVEGDWLRAADTTLGADNGIAIAIALELADDSGTAHPPLELLFTVDEETGLYGAKQLQPGFIAGKILLNVDSESEGVFTVGCAGGRDTHISGSLSCADLPVGRKIFNVAVQGLKGGHSGVDIHRHRGNAVKILARVLHRFNAGIGIRLLALKGGSAHNAIPREASATVACRAPQVEDLQRIFADVSRAVQSEHAATEPRLLVSLAQCEPHSTMPALTFEDTARVIHMLLAFPHGVKERSPVIEGLVETSSNLAKVEVADGSLHIVTSQRSSVMSRLDEITVVVEAVAALAGTATRNDDEYPPWQPDLRSPLLERCKGIYKQLFQREPAVQAIHAGLECGIIGAKFPGMDMISLGPTIENAHSPDERLYIPSVKRVWEFLTALLQSYGNQGREA